MLHHEVDGAAMRPTDKAAEGVPAPMERHAGVVVVVERTEAFMPGVHAESQSLRDPLNREVAKPLQFLFIHAISGGEGICQSYSRVLSGQSK